MALDGCGSAARSQLGAAASLLALRAALEVWEDEIASVLDRGGRGLAAIGWQGLACRLYLCGAEEQRKLAEWYETEPSEFEHTLTLCLAGKEHFGWLAVGDCPLVIRKNGIAGLVPQPRPTAFANQTDFVSMSPRQSSGLQGGVIPASGIEGVFAMSDGAASRLMNLRDHVPALAVSEIMDLMGSGEWYADSLSYMLENPSWNLVTRDDRCVALFTRNTKPSKRPASPKTSRNMDSARPSADSIGKYLPWVPCKR